MIAIARFVAWLARIAVFALLFGLALKNSGPMELRFFFEQRWQAPISVVLLTVFAAGVGIGLSVALTVMFRRREP